MKKSTYKKVWPLIICFLLPMFIMAFYFAYRNMSPFGNRSILTVDLGQQYVDLFAYFKHTVLSDPSGIFYSFSKAFGGEMFGTWAYYLLSPVNLLLLLIPTSALPAGILIITLIKYGLSGLSFGYLLTRTVRPNISLTIMWSTIYALNGWIIANQLNIMWLDGMIWLPLVILGINQIFTDNHVKIYIISMTMAIITNYYMAYMIFLFTIIYVGFKFTTSSFKHRHLWLVIRKLLMSVLTCFGLTAWLTLPTLFSLTQGKARYTRTGFTSRFEYLPFKMVSKLFNSSLNFDQLPHGLPNIFVGSVTLIGFMIYFCQTKVPVRKKISGLIVTLILLLSLCYQPLDLLWHAGQFPIWYPYRFSFIVCFWIIWIAANAISGKYRMGWISSTIIAALIGALIVYVFTNLINFPFIAPLNFVIGTLFLLISFILLIYTHNNSRVFSISLLILSTCEMSLNAFNSLNNLSYISNRNYTHYTQQLSQEIHWIGHRSQSPFRIGKTFYRSKDDPFSNHYSGGDTFDSSLEYTTPQFMKAIGQPEGQGFVTYSNGTLISDQLLNYRYYITTNDRKSIKSTSFRPDLATYPVVQRSNHFKIHKNTNELPLIFSTGPRAFHIQFTKNPVINQGRWYHAITNQGHPKFIRSHFTKVSRSNLKTTADSFQAINPMKAGTLSLTLKPRRHYSYYLMVSPRINNKNFSVTQDGHSILPNVTYNHSIILNLASGDSPKRTQIIFRLFPHALKSTPIKLYRLSHKISIVNDRQTRIHFVNNRKINGTCMTTPKRPYFGTSIPATKGWHLTIDGRSRKIHKIAHEFIGAQVKPGRHRFRLTYLPPRLPIGILITSLTLLVIVSKLINLKQVNKKG